MLKQFSTGKSVAISDVIRTRFNLPKKTDFRLESEPSDEEFLENIIKDPYYAHCPLSKTWIEHDQSNQTAVDDKIVEEEIDVKLLQELDDNIRYDILEFIPTYSKWF